MGPLRPGQRDRSRAHLGVELPLHLPGAVAQARGEPGHALAVHDTVTDQPHRTADRVGAGVPLGRAGHRVGAAAAAGPEPGALRGGRGREEAHVLPLGCGRRATGAAVDPGRGHGEEELAVEPGVAAAHRLVPAVVGRHTSTVGQDRAPRWRKSDITFAGRWAPVTCTSPG